MANDEGMNKSKAPIKFAKAEDHWPDDGRVNFGAYVLRDEPAKPKLVYDLAERRVSWKNARPHPNPLPQEREKPLPRFCLAENSWCSGRSFTNWGRAGRERILAIFSKGVAASPPLPGGEGWGEGGLPSHHCFDWAIHFDLGIGHSFVIRHSSFVISL